MKKILLFTTTILLNATTLTIYNNNLGYVIEQKSIKLEANKTTYRYENMPESVIVSSIMPEFKSSDVKLLSQLYQNSNNNFNKKLLEANLDKEVEFYQEDKTKLKKGVLVRVEPIVIKSDDRYYVIDSIKDIIFNKMPDENRLKSYIEWYLDVKKEGSYNLDLNYLIDNISWSSNYTLTLNRDTLNLKCWAVIANRSGKDFKDVSLNLIAGRLNRSYETRAVKKMVKSNRAYYSEAVSPAVAEVVAPKSFSGYYLYNIKHKESLQDNQIKEIALIDAKDIKYRVYGEATNRGFSNYGTRKIAFDQVIEFENKKQNNLGVAMPEGLVRVYKSGYYLGENHIAKTPKNEKLKIKIGELFDIVGKKRVVEYIYKKSYKKIKVEYILKNRGKRAYQLKLNENIPRYGDRVKFKTSCNKSCRYKEKNAFNREFKIDLEANSSYKFTTEIEIYGE
jgi:hypothetical protein